MKLTVIGSGTAAPEWDRACSGFMLETHRVRVLLDCGPGVVHNMARIGLEWRGITHLLLTHFHNDHIGDVPTLFFAWRHGMRPARSEPLTVIGPPGTKRLLERLGDVFGDHLREPEFELDVVELDPASSDEGGEARGGSRGGGSRGAGAAAERSLGDEVRLRAMRTPHTDASLAYRIEADGRSFCYTGDTGMSEAVAGFAQGVDALLIECSVPDDEAMSTHLTPSQVAAMARIALPRRLLVTHVYPQLDRRALPELVRLGGWPARVDVVADGDMCEL
jgi:ribonuclease BN (tRNA processing enzyme)